MRLAEKLSLQSAEGVDDRLMAELERHFTDAEIMELAMVIAVLVGMAKMLFAFNFVEKEPYCRF